MRYQQTCTSCSGPILFGFLTENIFIFPLIYWGSWFNAVRIIFSPIKNHVWVAVSRYYIFRPACVASWNNTCYIPLGSYYLCHSFFNGCCDFFHHRNPSGFILYLLDALRYGYDFTWCISRWFEMDRTFYMSRKAEFLKDVFCSIRMVPFQYVLYAVY